MNIDLCIRPGEIDIEDVSRRFWAKVHKTDTCWLWTGSKGHLGHGQFTIRRRRYVATRISWLLHFGAWPDALVCHRCDVGACVRPDHLFLGTQSDNMIDCVLKKRHSHQKLNPHAIEAIRSLGGKMKQRDIAAQFGVCQKTIWLILKGETWAHI